MKEALSLVGVEVIAECCGCEGMIQVLAEIRREER